MTYRGIRVISFGTFTFTSGSKVGVVISTYFVTNVFSSVIAIGEAETSKLQLLLLLLLLLSWLLLTLKVS